MSRSALRLLPLFLLLGTVRPAVTQGPQPQADRVAAHADLHATTRLVGHIPIWAVAGNDAGAVPNDLNLRLTFALTRSPDRQAAFTQMLVDQQNTSSPLYHHWLTPLQIGATYGPTQHDIDALTNWLTSQGFTITDIAPSGLFITTTAPASTVAAALHTSFRYFTINAALTEDKPRRAPTSAPALPTALAGIVGSISGLADSLDEPLHHMEVVPAVATNDTAQSDTPLLTSTSGNHFVTPGDFAAIYDLNSVYNSGLSGAGQKVAIIGRSQVAPADITNYQTLVGQPSKLPTVVIPPTGADPGATGTGDQSEATLDVQRVLGTAPGAQADLVVSSGATGGIQTAMLYNIQTLLDPIMTVSFGSCELLNSASSVAFYDALFSQAAAEGIAVFISSGDSGAATCDTIGAPPPANQFASMNFLCSSQYVTCVGGTEFADTTNPAAYWNATNTSGRISAISYIPEGAWNDPTTTDINGNTITIALATGGGASIYIPKPSFQAGTGVPADGARDTPDISFSAARHDAYFGCYSGSPGNCVPSATGGFSFVGYAGTSASAPSMAAIAALLNQKLAGPQGPLNPLLYRLAASTPNTFHDTTPATSGVANCTTAVPSMCNNSLPSPTGLTGGLPGFALTAGYDQATGLGSLDVANFLAAASPATVMTAVTALAITASTPNLNLGQTATFTATLTSKTAGTPTGSVQFYANTTPLGAPIPIASGQAVTGSIPFPKAGSFIITAVYSGDATFSPSTAPGVAIAVLGFPSITTLTTAATTVVVNSTQTFTATVAPGVGATGTPTGLIEFVRSGLLVATVPLTNGQATSPALTFPFPGTANVFAFYRGDTTFASSASNLIPVTVTAPTYQISATPTTLSLTAGASTGNTATINIAQTGGFVGTVNLTCAVTFNGTGTPSFPPTCSLASSAVVVAAAPATTTLTLMTTLPHSIRGPSVSSTQGPALIRAGEVLFSALLLILLPTRRRSVWRALSSFLILSATLAVLAGCGGGSSTPTPTPTPPPTPIGTTAGSYTVTVTASSTVAGVPAPAPITIALTIN